MEVADQTSLLLRPNIFCRQRALASSFEEKELVSCPIDNVAFARQLPHGRQPKDVAADGAHSRPPAGEPH
jgi:hypothetical protein